MAHGSASTIVLCCYRQLACMQLNVYYIFLEPRSKPWFYPQTMANRFTKWVKFSYLSTLHSSYTLSPVQVLSFFWACANPLRVQILTTSTEDRKPNMIYKTSDDARTKSVKDKKVCINAWQRSRVWAQCKSSHVTNPGAFRSHTLQNCWVATSHRR